MSRATAWTKSLQELVALTFGDTPAAFGRPLRFRLRRGKVVPYHWILTAEGRWLHAYRQSSAGSLEVKSAGSFLIFNEKVFDLEPKK